MRHIMKRNPQNSKFLDPGNKKVISKTISEFVVGLR